MAAVKNLYVDQGADFDVQFVVYNNNNNPRDLTDYTGLAKIKKSYYSTTYVSFLVTFSSTRTDGIVNLNLTSSQTSLMEQGRYLYDVVLSDPSNKKIRVIEGVVTINPGVT